MNMYTIAIMTNDPEITMYQCEQHKAIRTGIAWALSGMAESNGYKYTVWTQVHAANYIEADTIAATIADPVTEEIADVRKTYA